ncbi:MAG TPA: PD-(D/E)XK nuclease family protein [Candidatus Krumholzibacteria bacterium]|nr:PD-(D/E)XK nuclease family protein [Candidatus Krumholzibacteria bacterium]HPD70666.1 PD-(D/E)XK nuclease family protein [Candidatus Krumholzibacteria bacterium]HRY39634.1 PD-(D/E)XK nuclease family protein [Candidatus Krumholzibacteria bacterium]
MPLQLDPLPLGEPILPALSRWLLAHRPGPAPEDLASVLVLLPSSRACGQLAHALGEASSTAALLLPRILTPARLADHLADLLGLDGGDLPDPALRPLLLGPRLACLDWLRGRPEAAPGIAGELLALFDEVRLARQEDLVLAGRDDARVLGHAEEGGEDALLADLDKVRVAWRLYREILPHDHVDRRREASERAGRHWPGGLPALVAAAHLGRLDRMTADLLASLVERGVPTHWLTASADDPRSRLLLATYRDANSPAHPLRAIRRLAERLCARAPLESSFAAPDLPARLGGLAAAGRQLAAGGPIRLCRCREPEHESREVARTVCRALAGAEPGRVPTVLVACPDRGLAARIAAQLRDAGVDVDDTRGRPLASLAAGRLLRDLVATVAGGWSFTALFEVLTHPYVRIGTTAERPGHAVKVQVLEAAVRRAGTARRGLGALEAIARDDDELSRGQRRWRLRTFVSDLAAAFAPLAATDDIRREWPVLLGDLRSAWSRLAPDHPLGGDREPRGDFADLGAVDGLLGALEQVAARLQRATIEEFSAALAALVADPAFEVRPHRQRDLPVRLMGLVEARLEHADHVILAGLNQDVFPGRLARPLLLGDRLRRALELDTWRDRAVRDAELFLRLLHVAPRVTLTWSRTREAQDALPSPLVQRLQMVAPGAVADAGDEPLPRRRVPDAAELAAPEAAFRAEPEPIPAPAVRPPARLSHSAMQLYRECPYRFLLASALGLRRPDPLEAAFTPLTLGNLAHAAMKRWLEPAGPAQQVLAAGQPGEALDLLHAGAVKVFERCGGDLPGAAVALRSFLALGPELVAFESARAAVWRPLALEAEFAVTLAAAAAWLATRGVPAPAVPEALGGVQLRGYIDRVDVRVDGTPFAAVVDYKTGAIPARRRVSDGRDLQLALYALAVEAGTVAGLPAPSGGGGWRVDHAGFYGLSRRGLGLPARPHLQPGDELQAGVSAILDQALAILDPAVPYALVPDWKEAEAAGQLPCRACEFRGVCRLEERDGGSALAARVAAMLAATRKGEP